MGFSNIFKRKHEQANPVLPAEEGLVTFLKQYNCQYKVELPADDESDRKLYIFQYQGGNYLGFVMSTGIVVQFPGIFTTGMDNINLVRWICNEENDTPYYSYTYHISKETNDVVISMSFFTRWIDIEDFRGRIEGFFSRQRRLVEVLEQAIEDAGNTDAEADRAMRARVDYLLLEHEFSQQPPKIDRESLQSRGTVLDVVSLLLGIRSAPLQLQVVSGVDFKQIDMPDEIKGFAMVDALGVGDDGTFARQSATIVLHYSNANVAVLVKAEHADDKALYYRAFLSCDNPDICIRPADKLKGAQACPSTARALFALDLTTDKQREQEADFMWKDALDKIAEGLASQLTPEQKAICKIHDAETAHHAYLAKKMICSERWADALVHLDIAYRSLLGSVFDLDEDERRAYLDLCFDLGLCYCKLGAYRDAVYYLDQLKDIGLIKFSRQYIIAMLGCNNPELISYIMDVERDVAEKFGDDEKPEPMANFSNFLIFSKGQAYLQFGKRQKAAREFKRLVDDDRYGGKAAEYLSLIEQQSKSSPA